MLKPALLVTAILVLTSLSVQANDKKHHDNSAVSISNAYIRVLPGAQKNTAAFVHIHNASDRAINLQSLNSTWAETVDLHQSTMEQGMIKMRPLDTLSIPAGSTVEFHPGQDHIMFSGLKKKLQVGDTVDLKLCFGYFCQQIDLLAVSVLDDVSAKKSHTHHHD